MNRGRLIRWLSSFSTFRHLSGGADSRPVTLKPNKCSQNKTVDISKKST